MVKVCSMCKAKKELSEFSKKKSSKDVLQSLCKSCNKHYRETNKERIKGCKDKWYQSNKERLKEKQKEYDKANRQRLNIYIKKRKQTDPLFKLKCNLRTRTYRAFKNKGYSKDTKTQQMLGIDWEIAKQYIERQFKKGMNWSNQGEWHIDHIIPLASAKTTDRLKQLCHYTNLQPMWAEENLSKKDSINGQQTLLRI
tara:strand:- start:2248 stop:2838 length:591 start_codon:yes stop_codon:yes gene_type:complete